MGLHPGRTVTFLMVLILGACSSAGAHEISGRVKMKPPYPEAKKIKVRKKVQDSCAEEQISKSLLVSSQGGVANAVIWLEGNFVPSSPAKTQVVLDQSQCNFEPHVALVPPGGSLMVHNSDPLAHDVRAFDAASMLFRLDMDTRAKPEEKGFDKPGIYTLRCGLHPWMHAFAVKAAHDFYAVTDPEGKFQLKHIPAGR